MVADIAYLQQTQQEIAQLEQLFARQRSAYRAHPMPSAEQRVQWLNSLAELISSERESLIKAISADFSNRSADETILAEIMPSLHAIHYSARRVKKWMKPSRRSVGLAFMPAAAKVVYQPVGVVGVIVPWNYPLYLAMGPLIGALAAGNRVMIKMSESTPATAALVKSLLARIFPEDLVCVVLGEVELGVAFSKLPFDHLLFTGATSVGKHVMRAAAENLTPVTLELGGKSPAIVSANVPLRDAAERIAFGKTLNAGQTCVAPDYVLVPKGPRRWFRCRLQRSGTALPADPQGQPGLHRRHQRASAGTPEELHLRRRKQGCPDHPAVCRRPGPPPAAHPAAERER